MALYNNPTELWQIRANQTGIDPSAPTPAGKMSGDGSLNGAPTLDMRMDSTGNMYNANAAQAQQWMQSQLGGPAPVAQPQSTPQSDFWAIANGKPTLASDNTMTAADFTSNDPSNFWSPQSTPESKAQNMGLQQNSQGNWYNPNSGYDANYVATGLGANASDADRAAALKAIDPSWVDPSTIDVNAQRAATAADVAAQRANLPLQTEAPVGWNGIAGNTLTGTWADYGAPVSWDQFMKGANTSGLTDTQLLSLGNSVPSYESALAKSNHLLDNLQDWSTIPGVTPQSQIKQQINVANAGLKAQASGGALQGLYQALQSGSGATADQIAQLLSNSKLLEDSFGNAYDTGGGGTQGWYDQIGQALGGYDYAGAMAKMRATPYTSSADASQRWTSALQDVANYLASPTRKINSSALAALAKNLGGYWGDASGAAQGMLGTANMLKSIDSGPNTKQLY